MSDREFEISRDSMLGVPITGDYNEGLDWGEQGTAEDFAALMQPVLDDPEIVRFGWDQYTPYFNDGDTCEFGTHRPWFVTKADEAAKGFDYFNDGDFDEYEYEVGDSWSGHPTLGKVEAKENWNSSSRHYETNPKAGQYTGYSRATYDRCEALSDAIDGSRFYRVLLDAFGDHAEITFVRDADTGQWSATREHASHD